MTVTVEVEMDLKCAKCGEYLDHDELFGFIRVEPCNCVIDDYLAKNGLGERSVDS